MHDLTIAAVSMTSLVSDKPANLARMDYLLSQAAAARVELVCFPELAVTGYSLHPDLLREAEPIPGPSTDHLLGMARRYNLAIVAGLVERGPLDCYFVSQVVVSPTGSLAVYRKTHLSPMEQRLFTPGDELQTAAVSGVIYGILLCYEGHFPELSTIYALQGAEVLLVPHASPSEAPPDRLARWLRYLPARAYDNSVFLVALNQSGDNRNGLIFPGVAFILDPKGRILAEWTGYGDHILTAELKAETLLAVRKQTMGYFLPRRRVDMYHPIQSALPPQK
ncbi:MAG: nitrilase [Deltaproteobacteria bacterium]|nr:nitrilase [Deltaproteobacteria bacterium]